MGRAGLAAVNTAISELKLPPLVAVGVGSGQQRQGRCGRGVR
jgi:hypothetical protein